MPIPGVDTTIELTELDETPDITDGHTCEEPGCTNPTFRNGDRGRWPKFCTEHKKTAGRAPSGKSSTNAKLAGQAADALCQVHGLVGAGCMLLSLNRTASAIATATHDGFREQAYSALLTDPDLARMILKAGTQSGRVALALTYAMFAAAVVPTAVIEVKERKAARDAKKAEEKAAQEAEQPTFWDNDTQTFTDESPNGTVHAFPTDTYTVPGA